MKPKRLQRKRQKGWSKPPNSVIVDRTSKWGNPFIVGEHINKDVARVTDPIVLDEGVIVRDIAHAIELYRMWITGDWKTDYLKRAATMLFEKVNKQKIINELGGKDLICFCKEGDPCHADILLEIAN